MKIVRVVQWLGVIFRNICIRNEQGYFLFVEIIIPSFPHKWCFWLPSWYLQTPLFIQLCCLYLIPLWYLHNFLKQHYLVVFVTYHYSNISSYLSSLLPSSYNKQCGWTKHPINAKESIWLCLIQLVQWSFYCRVLQDYRLQYNYKLQL